MVTSLSPATASGSTARVRSLRVGFLSLTDAAPFVVAQELGHFARHDLRVQLSREIGWATIREKIIYGELDAAHAPAPSAMTRARSASSFIALAICGSGTTIDPAIDRTSGHIVSSTDLPPAPSTNEACHPSKYPGRPAASDDARGDAVSGSAA